MPPKKKLAELRPAPSKAPSTPMTRPPTLEDRDKARLRITDTLLAFLPLELRAAAAHNAQHEARHLEASHFKAHGATLGSYLRAMPELKKKIGGDAGLIDRLAGGARERSSSPSRSASRSPSRLSSAGGSRSPSKPASRSPSKPSSRSPTRSPSRSTSRGWHEKRGENGNIPGAVQEGVEDAHAEDQGETATVAVQHDAAPVQAVQSDEVALSTDMQKAEEHVIAGPAQDQETNNSSAVAAAQQDAQEDLAVGDEDTAAAVYDDALDRAQVQEELVPQKDEETPLTEHSGIPVEEIEDIPEPHSETGFASPVLPALFSFDECDEMRMRYAAAHSILASAPASHTGPLVAARESACAAMQECAAAFAGVSAGLALEGEVAAAVDAARAASARAFDVVLEFSNAVREAQQELPTEGMGTLETLQAELAAFHEQRAMLRTSIEVLRVLNGELSGNETTTGQEQAGDMQMPGIGLQEEAVALQISAETVQLSIAPMDEELAAAEQDATKETMQELPGPEDEALTPLTAVAEVEEKAAPAIEVSEAPSAQLVTDPEPAKVEEEPATPDTAGTSYEEDAGPEEEKQAPQQETERTGLELGDIVVVAMIPLMIFVSVLRRVLDYAEARV